MPEPLILLGAVAAGFVQGVSGFALGLVAMVFWSGALPPQQIAPLIALGSIAGQALALRTILPAFEVRRAGPMVAGGVLGVPFGLMLLPLIDAGLFRLSVGLLLCVWCPAMLLARQLPRVTRGGGLADGGAGFIGGMMGGIAGLNGPAPTLWCALRGWPPDTQRAVYQPFLIIVHLAALLGYGLTGLLTADVWRLAAWIIPFMLVPSLLGIRLYARLSAATFRRVILGLLALTGVGLVLQSLGSAIPP